MVYDARGNRYSERRTIGFRRLPRIDDGPSDISLPDATGSLPAWLADESSQAPVAARHHGAGFTFNIGGR